MRSSRGRVLFLLATMSAGGGSESDGEIVQNPPADAIFCPADYDRDGLMDVAVKGGNVASRREVLGAGRT